MTRKPRKPTTRRGTLARRAAFRAPSDLSPDESNEFQKLAADFAQRLQPGDSPDLAALARIRVYQRALNQVLDKEGPLIESRGARKAHPAIAAIAELRAEERRITVRLGLQRPNPSLARQLTVAKEREALAEHVFKTMTGPGGRYLGTEEFFHALEAGDREGAMAICRGIARRAR